MAKPKRVTNFWRESFVIERVDEPCKFLERWKGSRFVFKFLFFLEKEVDLRVTRPKTNEAANPPPPPPRCALLKQKKRLYTIAMQLYI